MGIRVVFHLFNGRAIQGVNERCYGALEHAVDWIECGAHNFLPVDLPIDFQSLQGPRE
jgi:hypothetical protein